jgi:hypothetical protein
MKNLIKLMAAAMIIVAVSCSKNNTDTGTGIAVSFKATTSLLAGSPSSSQVTKSSEAAGFTFSEALIGIKQIELKREEEQFSDSAMAHNPMNKHKFDFEGNYLIDLLTGISTPDIGFADFVPGTYNKFESETARLVPGGKSISVIGSYTDPASKVYNFNFSTKAEFEFEFESDSGFVLTEGKVMEMLININLPLLFSTVDFSKGTADANGIIVIDETTNTELFKSIKHNIHSIGDMHEDHKKEMEHKQGM